MNIEKFKNLVAREDSERNDRIHYFSSKVNVYFSYLFYKLKFTADQVTIIFGLIGTSAAALSFSKSYELSILSYILWRIQIIVDMSDGDIARLNQSFSHRGIYWDHLIHLLVNTTFCFGLFYGNPKFDSGELGYTLLHFFVITYIVFLSAKYFRGQVKSSGKNEGSSLRLGLRSLLVDLTGLEGLLLVVILRHFISLDIFYLLIYLFMASNLVKAFVIVYIYSYKSVDIEY